MPRTKCLKLGELSENSIQKAVIQWVKLKPSLRNFVIHIPNEGKRTPHYGKYLKEMGMRPGVSDLFIALARHGYFGAWIELKSTFGKLSAAQKNFMIDMMSKNYFAATCNSIEEAIKIISWYCFEESHYVVRFDPVFDLNC